MPECPSARRASPSPQVHSIEHGDTGENDRPLETVIVAKCGELERILVEVEETESEDEGDAPAAASAAAPATSPQHSEKDEGSEGEERGGTRQRKEAKGEKRPKHSSKGKKRRRG